MTAVARFDLKMNADEKEVVSRAAALMGTTMAAFVRAAAKDKAYELLERESRAVFSERDFQSFTSALELAFAPNPALTEALQAARQVKRV